MSGIAKCLGLLAVAAMVVSPQLAAQPGASVAVDADDIGGVVTGPNGPEAGVWVIAETTELPTKFAKMVVTDERGRYVIPDLPPANYDTWVRGYDLIDSPKVRSAPGRTLDSAPPATRTGCPARSRPPSPLPPRKETS